MYNISKFYGIPASYKTALKSIKEIAEEESKKYHNSGFLVIKKKYGTCCGRPNIAYYPIYYYANDPKLSDDILKVIKF